MMDCEGSVGEVPISAEGVTIDAPTMQQRKSTDGVDLLPHGLVGASCGLRRKRSRSVTLLYGSGVRKKASTFCGNGPNGAAAVLCLPLETAPLSANADMDVEAEMRYLLRWLRQLEQYLYSDLSSYTVGGQELRNHLAVQSSIEKVVGRLHQVKNGVAEESRECGGRLSRLEKRLHHCWLKSLERQFILEEIVQGTWFKGYWEREGDYSPSDLSYYEPLQKCPRLTMSDSSSVHSNLNPPHADADNTPKMHLASSTPTSTTKKSDLVSQDIGYASESSTLNLSMDDVSPSQPALPPLTSPTVNMLSTAHSDTDSSNKCDVRRREAACTVRASPNEFYYKVAPMALDIRAEALTRSAKGSLSRLRGGPALAFTDDEEGSSNFRCSAPQNEPTTCGQSGANLTPPRDVDLQVRNKRRDNMRRARTLPPEERTTLLASQCTPRKTRSHTHKRRPWSLILQESCTGTGTAARQALSSAVSESALSSCRRGLAPKAKAVERRKRQIVVDQDRSMSSSEEVEEEEEEEEDGWPSASDEGSEKEAAMDCSRRTLISVPSYSYSYSRKSKKSQSTSALWRHESNKRGDFDAIFWDDYQDPPYSSEAYSEKCVDESIVQRITNFGDDYSAIFSTSSCCTVDMSSSHSQQEQEQEHVSSDTDWDCQREKNMFFDGGGDEESVLAESRRQLRIAQTALALSLEGQVGCCDLKELRRTCQMNLSWLSRMRRDIKEELEEASMEDVISQWDHLHAQMCQREICGAFLRSASRHLRDIQMQLQSYRLCFSPAPDVDNHVLVRSVAALVRFRDSTQSRASNLEGMEKKVKTLINQITGHLSTCCCHSRCTPTCSTLVEQSSDTLEHVRLMHTQATHLVDQTTSFLSLLQSAWTKMETLEHNMTLPDLILTQSNCHSPPSTLRTEWRHLKDLMGEMKGYKRFVLMDRELIEKRRRMDQLLEETSPHLTESEEKQSQSNCAEREREKGAIWLVGESKSGADCWPLLPRPQSGCTDQERGPCSPLSHKAEAEAEQLSCQLRRTCLVTMPLVGLLIFLCLLLAFLLEPQCCSFSTQRSLLSLSYDYPTGTPPI